MKLIVLPRLWKTKLAHKQDIPKVGRRKWTDPTWQKFFYAEFSTFASEAPAVIGFLYVKSQTFQQDFDPHGPTTQLFTLQTFSPKVRDTVK